MKAFFTIGLVAPSHCYSMCCRFSTSFPKSKETSKTFCEAVIIKKAKSRPHPLFGQEVACKMSMKSSPFLTRNQPGEARTTNILDQPSDFMVVIILINQDSLLRSL